MTTPQNLGFWFNGTMQLGATIELPITDPGLLYGATVFTTLRVYHQSLDHPLTHWPDHCDRLRANLQTFRWRTPDWQRVHQGAVQMSQHYPILRITLFPDGREWITGRPLPADLTQRQQQGITAWVADPDWARSLPAQKTGNYLAPWLALQTAQTHQAQEAILTNSQGHWLETSTGNLWGYTDGTWYTPPLDNGLLAGIQRRAILQFCQSQGLPTAQVPWTTDLIQRFHVMAYSNCVVEIVPINRVLLGERWLSFAPDRSPLQALHRYFIYPNP
ncbi:aminotransferase class IV [Alkalinema sp. FACHB-956]|uniref:aminotransferase class IV n=1 Tax=Alkalinema sp. FACHB-956 TaxID=2692768 RepID=UPI0016839570|nr:aminotransferase class IV [Alkalinema sp. FACHB-956]MBD2329501.1 aminotransferase class IV [Alkalinema sp. FACHB-956]